MRDEKKHLVIDQDEQNTLIKVLNDMRNIYKEEGIATDSVDELILKIADVKPRQAIRVAEHEYNERY